MSRRKDEQESLLADDEWTPISAPKPLFRREKRARVALVGQPKSGKSEIFNIVSSTSVHTDRLSGTDKVYSECPVNVGLDEINLIDLPSMMSLRHLKGDDLESLKYILWGDDRPMVSAHESSEPPAPFRSPDVIVHVIDSTMLGRSLELSFELATLGKPVVLALNMMDQAKAKGLTINLTEISKTLGMPVVPMTAIEGHGISEVFETALEALRSKKTPALHECYPHIEQWRDQIETILDQDALAKAFAVPVDFLVTQIVEQDEYFTGEMEMHFPDILIQCQSIIEQANVRLPRSIAAEMDVERHHHAMSLAEDATGFGKSSAPATWSDLFDGILLHPQWGVLTSLSVFAAILYVVFEFSGILDAVSSAPLAGLLEAWNFPGLDGLIYKSVLEGMVGLVGIVIPYMLPLILLLVTMEQTGVMQRIAFVVDRMFHHLGLHGNVAFPFLLGMGCNVPAISALHQIATGRDKVIASVLVTFVPCSARSGVVLALGGMYLGGIGVFAIFMLTIAVIAILSRILTAKYPSLAPGQVQSMPEYSMPQFGNVFKITWDRIKDVITIVLPLLVLGTVIVALLQYAHVDDAINRALSPIVYWALGLPVVLGVPLLFGILRKELSLAMMFQALGVVGVAGVAGQMDWIQIFVFLIFLTFYVPCVSTIAIMMKTIGFKQAIYSVFLSTGVALLIAFLLRLVLESVQWVLKLL
ncbi:MAG: ferrous iron transporter B [Zetaproteobacteria bacterium]|nr:ferrous iron transporter B [Zetaproteobacteria bacterium]